MPKISTSEARHSITERTVDLFLITLSSNYGLDSVRKRETRRMLATVKQINETTPGHVKRFM